MLFPFSEEVFPGHAEAWEFWISTITFTPVRKRYDSIFPFFRLKRPIKLPGKVFTPIFPPPPESCMNWPLGSEEFLLEAYVLMKIHPTTRNTLAHTPLSILCHTKLDVYLNNWKNPHFFLEKSHQTPRNTPL